MRARFPSFSNHYPIKGFTLAELLIVLALLGVIAVFTVPKVLVNEQNQRNKSVLKETMAAIAALEVQGYNTGNYSNSYGLDSYIFSNLGAAKVCTQATNQGCWDPATQGGWVTGGGWVSGGSLNGRAAIMPSGASIVEDYGNAAGCCFDRFHFVIDANGASPPNQNGVDQLQFFIGAQPSGNGQAGRYSGLGRLTCHDAYIDVMPAELNITSNNALCDAVW